MQGVVKLNFGSLPNSGTRHHSRDTRFSVYEGVWNDHMLAKQSLSFGLERTQNFLPQAIASFRHQLSQSNEQIKPKQSPSFEWKVSRNLYHTRSPLFVILLSLYSYTTSNRMPNRWIVGEGIVGGVLAAVILAGTILLCASTGRWGGHSVTWSLHLLWAAQACWITALVLLCVFCALAWIRWHKPGLPKARRVRSILAAGQTETVTNNQVAAENLKKEEGHWTDEKAIGIFVIFFALLAYVIAAIQGTIGALADAFKA